MKKNELKLLIRNLIKEEINKSSVLKEYDENFKFEDDIDYEDVTNLIIKEFPNLKYDDWGNSKYDRRIEMGNYIFHKNLGDDDDVRDEIHKFYENNNFLIKDKISINNKSELNYIKPFVKRYYNLLKNYKACLTVCPDNDDFSDTPILIELDYFKIPFYSYQKDSLSKLGVMNNENKNIQGEKFIYFEDYLSGKMKYHTAKKNQTFHYMTEAELLKYSKFDTDFVLKYILQKFQQLKSQKTTHSYDDGEPIDGYVIYHKNWGNDQEAVDIIKSLFNNHRVTFQNRISVSNVSDFSKIDSFIHRYKNTLKNKKGYISINPRVFYHGEKGLDTVSPKDSVDVELVIDKYDN